MIYGSCAPELQRIAIKVLSQTTSASNCERNWSTFSFIHTKTRNRLKFARLQKLVFTFYNMKLKMRHTMRSSQEEIEDSFNPINLDYIFQEEDPLSPWLEEREGPVLDGMQNSEWLPVDSDNDGNDNEGGAGGDNLDSSETPSQGGGGLSPPSDNSGNDNDSGGGGGGNTEQSQERGEDSYHSFQEDPAFRRDQNLIHDLTLNRRDENPSDDVSSGSRRGGSNRRRSRRQNAMFGDSSSSNVSAPQSFRDIGVGTSSGSSQRNNPPYYQNPPYMPYGYYQPMPAPPYYQPMPVPPYYPPPYYPPQYYQPPVTYQPQYGLPQQMEVPRSSGVFDYVFGGMGNNDDDQNDDEGYDPARHSAMW